MLILTRKPGQEIIVGPRDVTFAVLGIKGNQVRIGVTADKNVTIHRDEIYNKIEAEAEAEKDSAA